MTNAESEAAKSKKRLLIIFLLGFSSGLPLALTKGTLQAWLTDSGLNIKTISLFALVSYPYNFKFLWAPLMSHFQLPIPGLGLRRAWIFACQILLAGSIYLLGQSQPANGLLSISLFAICVAFFSASQDIVVDAYRSELLSSEELGRGASLAITGYRLAMIVSGALALGLAESLSWSTIYSLMAALCLALAIVTYYAPEPEQQYSKSKNLNEAFIQPIVSFFKRRGSKEILLFIVLYKLPDVLAMSLQTTFFLHLGFAKTEIAAIGKIFGLSMGILGGLIGGSFLDYLGMKRALIIFGFLQGISVLSMAYLANVGKSHAGLTVAILLENLASGLGNSAFVAFLMGEIDKRHSATQYALLSGLAAVPTVLIASASGFLVESMGWTNFYFLSALSAIPAIMLIALRWETWRRE